MTTNIFSEITQSLWLKGAQINKQLDNSLGAIHGIGLSEFMVLKSLLDAPSHRLRRIDVAETIGRTASAVTRMLLPMEKIGLIEKVANERDARVSQVQLTKSGKKIVQEANLTLEQKSLAILKNLDDDSASELLNLINKI